MKGTVQWFSTRKGYGFIKGEDGKDVFVHHSALPAGLYLKEGDQVEFDKEESDRGPRAERVQKLEKTEEEKTEEEKTEEEKTEEEKTEEEKTEEEKTEEEKTDVQVRDITEIRGVGKKRAEALKAAGISTVEDLLETDTEELVSKSKFTVDHIEKLKEKARTI